MGDAERLKIAVDALRQVADDCERCAKYLARGVAAPAHCPHCDPAREALRRVGAGYPR